MIALQKWLALMIVIINLSVIFIQLDSDPYRDVPDDKMQTKPPKFADGEKPTIAINRVWARGWYTDHVAMFTAILAFALLASLPETSRKTSSRRSGGNGSADAEEIVGL